MTAVNNIFRLITARIDISVLNPLKAVMAQTKSPVTKECIIKTVDLIGKAMHPDHLQKKDFILKQRDDLIKVILAYMIPKEKAEANDNLKILGLNACTTLMYLEVSMIVLLQRSNLDPILPADLEKVLLERVISFYAIPPAGAEDKVTPQILDNLNTLLGAILISQPNTDCLCRLIKVPNVHR